MGANVKLYWVLSGFFFLAGVVYLIWSRLYYTASVEPAATHTNAPVEWVGTIALFLTSLLGALIAFYLGRTRRSYKGELPEDRVDANVDDGDAEQGFFSPWSWWPVTLGACAAAVFLGLAVGEWLIVFAVPLGLLALIGWNFEYFRRYFWH